MPNLCVLLPVKNGEATIRHAVRSTLADLPSDAELVVLDDGSSDGTLSQLHAIKDRRLMILEGSGSGNLGRALNHLLSRTDSEFVARMDADDVTLPGRFRRSLRPLQTGHDLVFASAVTFSRRSVAPSWPGPIHPEAFGLHLLLSNPVRHPALCARRAALDALGGYREVPSEDYDLWLRASVEGFSLLKTGWIGLAYRVHSQQITADPSWKRASHADPVLNESFARLCTSLLGSTHMRLVALEAGDPQAGRVKLAEFERDFTEATSALPRWQQVDLMRKLAMRRRRLERTWRSGQPSKEQCP